MKYWRWTPEARPRRLRQRQQRDELGDDDDQAAGDVADAVCERHRERGDDEEQVDEDDVLVAARSPSTGAAARRSASSPRSDTRTCSGSSAAAWCRADSRACRLRRRARTQSAQRHATPDEPVRLRTAAAELRPDPAMDVHALTGITRSDAPHIVRQTAGSAATPASERWCLKRLAGLKAGDVFQLLDVAGEFAVAAVDGALVLQHGQGRVDLGPAGADQQRQFRLRDRQVERTAPSASAPAFWRTAARKKRASRASMGYRAMPSSC